MEGNIDESGIRRAFEGRLADLLRCYDGNGSLTPGILCQYRDTKAEMYNSLQELHTGPLKEHYRTMARLCTEPLAGFTGSA